MKTSEKSARIRTVCAPRLRESIEAGGCGNCRASCQSACKTSCTVANQSCESSAPARCTAASAGTKTN